MALRTSIRIDGQGVTLLARQFRDVSRSIDKVGRSGTRVGRVLRRSLGGISRTASRLRSTFGGIAGTLGLGIGGGVAVKSILDVNEALAQLQVDGKLSNKEVLKLKGEVIALAKETGQMPSAILQGFRVFQDFGSQLSFGREAMKDLAKFAYATNTPIAEAARIAATLRKNLGLKTKNEVLDALIKIDEAGKAGNLSMADMANSMAEVFGAGKGAGFVGLRGVEEMVTAVQVVGGLTGNAERAKTAIARLFTDLTRNSNRIKKNLKIDIFDKDGNLKDLDVVIGQILSATKGLKTKLISQQGAGLSGISATTIASFAGTEDKSKLSQAARELFTTTRAKGIDRTNIQKMFDIKSTSAVGKSSFQVKRALATASASLQKYGGDMASWVADNPGLAAALGIGGIALGKITGGILGGIGARAGGLAAAQAAGVQKVYVVNMPMGGIGGGAVGGAVSGGGGIASKIGKSFAVTALGIAGIKAAESAAYGSLNRRSEIRKESGTNIVNMQALADQARQYRKLALSGISNLSIGGQQVPLTKEFAQQRVQALGSKLGVGEETMASLKPVLDQILSVLKDGPKVVVSAPGIDRPKVAVSRGAQ